MLKIDNLTVVKNEKIILSNISFNTDEKLIVISGESGSGKTTLLNCIGGIEKYFMGKINVNGIEIEKLTKKDKIKYIKNHVGFLFQDFGLIPNDTVYENLKFIKNASREKIINILKIFNMEKFIDTKVYLLSGGEQQRVALVRLMLKDCEIILADEPTGSLDDANAEIVIKELVNLSQNKIVVIVTHDMKIVNIAQNVLCL